MKEKKKLKFEYYFIRHSDYNKALKEAELMKETGWRLRKWHYEATTLTFILTMERPIINIKTEPEAEEETKPWRRQIKKSADSSAD